MRLIDSEMAGREPYMIVSKGRVMRLLVYIGEDAVRRRVWPITATFEDAMRLARWSGHWDTGTRPTRIGSLSGETVSQHFDAALEEQCWAVGLVRGWTDDGSPKFSWFALDPAAEVCPDASYAFSPP